MSVVHIGLNFIDTYHRSGLYPVPLPSGLGREGAGVVEALGADTPGWSEGRRVVFCGGSLGSYATHHLVPIRHLIELPEGGQRTVPAVRLDPFGAAVWLSDTPAGDELSPSLAWFAERMRNLDLIVWPSVANFVLLQFPHDAPLDAAHAQARLRERTVDGLSGEQLKQALQQFSGMPGFEVSTISMPLSWAR